MALVSHYFIYRLGKKANLDEFLTPYLSAKWLKPWQGKVGEPGWMSVKAAITAIIAIFNLSSTIAR